MCLALRSIHSFVRFSRFDSPEDRADLVQMRSAQQDILVDMWRATRGPGELPLVRESQKIIIWEDILKTRWKNRDLYTLLVF
jgi:hypothetical protein